MNTILSRGEFTIMVSKNPTPGDIDDGVIFVIPHDRSIRPFNVDEDEFDRQMDDYAGLLLPIEESSTVDNDSDYELEE